MCQLSNYDTKVKRSIRLVDSTHDVCLPSDFGRNLTLDNRGTMKLSLGDWFSPRKEFEKALVNRKKLHKILKVYLVKKQPERKNYLNWDSLEYKSDEQKMI